MPVAQLSFADLIVRRVPLTAAEATSLTLAAAAQGPLPDASEIFLSSTGTVTFGCPSPAVPADESAKLASLLHQLLRLDEADGAERRGRVPGGLLVVLARTMRQIDLPALTTTAFREALVRFGGQTDPGMLAAIFWRAARMRVPSRLRIAGAGLTPVLSRRRTERRSQGPHPAELRRWLRQAEREVFRLRQSRTAAVSAAVIAAFVVVVAMVIGLNLSDSSAAPASTDMALAPAQPVAVPAAAAPAPPVSTAASVAKRHVVDRSRPANRPVSQPARRPTVEMVNLPRASWAVVRTP